MMRPGPDLCCETMCQGLVRIIDDNRPSAWHAFRIDPRKHALSKRRSPIAAADCVQGSGSGRQIVPRTTGAMVGAQQHSSRKRRGASGRRPSKRRLSEYDVPDEEALGVSTANSLQEQLALWLLRREANGSDEPNVMLAAAERCLQKLCTRLAKLMTAAGCQSLVARAIHLAAAEAPFLHGVRAGLIPGACLDGVQESAVGLVSEQKQAGLVAVLAQLIGLVEWLIGHDVTRSLVRDVWPDLPLGSGLTDSAPKEALS
jgi:hypothetical protein